MDDSLPALCEIIHGLGERLPRRDTVALIQSVLLKQMILLVYRLQKAAILQNNQYISVKHLLYVLKDHKVTIIRILSYYYLKDIILKLGKLSKLGSIEELEKRKKGKKSQLQGLLKDDVVDNITNVEDESLKLDPAAALAAIDFTTKGSSSPSPASSNVKCIFLKLRNTIAELKLSINITEDEVKKANEARLTRVNDISILLSASGYEGFEICRRKSFHGRLGDKLLLQVQDVLPLNITFNSQVKDILMFLAKETINCLIDRVFVIRNCHDICDETNKKIIKKTKYRSILVHEITAVTSQFWKIPLSKIHNPYKEDDTFFNEQLIFDS